MRELRFKFKLKHPNAHKYPSLSGGRVFFVHIIPFIEYIIILIYPDRGIGYAILTTKIPFSYPNITLNFLK